jgi:hypothetical protein
VGSCGLCRWLPFWASGSLVMSHCCFCAQSLLRAPGFSVHIVAPKVCLDFGCVPSLASSPISPLHLHYPLVMLASLLFLNTEC